MSLASFPAKLTPMRNGVSRKGHVPSLRFEFTPHLSQGDAFVISFKLNQYSDEACAVPNGSLRANE